MCALLFAQHTIILAADHFFGALHLEATPTGAGTVYASTTQKDDPTQYDSSHTSIFDSEKENHVQTFYGFARPASEDIAFLGWTREGEDMIISTDNPITIQVPCLGKEEYEATTYNYVAHFMLPATSSFTVSLEPAEHGTYTAVTPEGNHTVSSTAITLAKEKGIVSLTLTAHPETGYKFLGWYTLSTSGTRQYLSYQPTFQTHHTEDITIYADFVDMDTPLFQISGSNDVFIGMEAALQAAIDNNSQTIILVSDGILTGNHTIPADITLLIPYDDALNCFKDQPRAINQKYQVTPYPYRTLTLAEGCQLDVQGAISLSACLWAPRGGDNPAGGILGPYGCIQTMTGSTITLHDGAQLYCWGYILGEGHVTALSGSTVHETFQFMDWQGGSATAAFNKAGVFPINQYYIQNIECPLTISHGAKEVLQSSLYADESIQQASVTFVGDEQSLFVLAEGASLTREYDSATDRNHYNISGNAKLSQITVTLGGSSVHSDSFILPITSNMSISIQGGTTTLLYDVSLLPGAEIAVAADATLLVDNGASLILYNADDWGPYARKQYLCPLQYLPTSTYKRTRDDLVDARLNINGNLTLNGYLYATEHGTSVSSTEGGTVSFTLGNGSLPHVFQCTAHKGSGENATAFVDTIPLTAPRLENGDGTYVVPVNEASTYVYEAEEGVWRQIIMGDINDDRLVNVSDVTALVDIILGKRSGMRQADINGDGKYDITDVTLLVNMILNKRG